MIRLTFLLAATRLCVYNLNLNMKIVAGQWRGREAGRVRWLGVTRLICVSLPQPEQAVRELTVAFAALRRIKSNFSDGIAGRGYEPLVRGFYSLSEAMEGRCGYERCTVGAPPPPTHPPQRERSKQSCSTTPPQ